MLLIFKHSPQTILIFKDPPETINDAYKISLETDVYNSKICTYKRVRTEYEMIVCLPSIRMHRSIFKVVLC